MPARSELFGCAVEPADYLSPCLPMKHGTQAKMWRDGKGRVLKDMRGGNLDKVRREWDLQLTAYRQVQQVAKPLELAGPFIIMEDLGESEPITNLEELYHHGQVLLEGLAAAKVLHRDLRPGNIIIGMRNRPYALDFGWARWEQKVFQDDDVLLSLTLHQMWEENHPCPT